jgi:hypothetical protein
VVAYEVDSRSRVHLLCLQCERNVDLLANRPSLLQLVHLGIHRDLANDDDSGCFGWLLVVLLEDRNSCCNKQEAMDV